MARKKKLPSWVKRQHLEDAGHRAFLENLEAERATLQWVKEQVRNGHVAQSGRRDVLAVRSAGDVADN